VIRSHLLHLVLYASLVAVFFAALVRRGWRAQLRFAGLTFAAMVGGALALAYLMFPFPK
jgi:amino acid permease